MTLEANGWCSDRHTTCLNLTTLHIHIDSLAFTALTAVVCVAAIQQAISSSLPLFISTCHQAWTWSLTHRTRTSGALSDVRSTWRWCSPLRPSQHASTPTSTASCLCVSSHLNSMQVQHVFREQLPARWKSSRVEQRFYPTIGSFFMMISLCMACHVVCYGWSRYNNLQVGSSMMRPLICGLAPTTCWQDMLTRFRGYEDALLDVSTCCSGWHYAHS